MRQCNRWIYGESILRQLRLPNQLHLSRNRSIFVHLVPRLICVPNRHHREDRLSSDDRSDLPRSMIPVRCSTTPSIVGLQERITLSNTINSICERILKTLRHRVRTSFTSRYGASRCIVNISATANIIFRKEGIADLAATSNTTG